MVSGCISSLHFERSKKHSWIIGHSYVQQYSNRTSRQNFDRNLLQNYRVPLSNENIVFPGPLIIKHLFVKSCKLQIILYIFSHLQTFHRVVTKCVSFSPFIFPIFLFFFSRFEESQSLHFTSLTTNYHRAYFSNKTNGGDISERGTDRIQVSAVTATAIYSFMRAAVDF